MITSSVTLGIDTATRVGGVALVCDGRFLGSQVLGAEESHSEHVVPAIQRLMQFLAIDSGTLSGIAVSHGPGSFTGLRNGLAVAKSLSYAWNVPLLGVSTLLATAWTYRGVDAVICAALDARRESVYRGLYDGRLLTEARDEGDGGDVPQPREVEGALSAEARVEVLRVVDELAVHVAKGRRVMLVGDGAPAIAAAWRGRVARGPGDGATLPGDAVWVAPVQGEPERPVNVAHLGELAMRSGSQDDAFALVPHYLRRSEAERRWKQRQP